MVSLTLLPRNRETFRLCYTNFLWDDNLDQLLMLWHELLYDKQSGYFNKKYDRKYCIQWQYLKSSDSQNETIGNLRRLSNANIEKTSQNTEIAIGNYSTY